MDTKQIAEQLGVSEKDVAAAVKQLAYRKAYNQRADVIEKRKVYNKLRQEKVKAALKLYDEMNK